MLLQEVLTVPSPKLVITIPKCLPEEPPERPERATLEGHFVWMFVVTWSDNKAAENVSAFDEAQRLTKKPRLREQSVHKRPDD